MNTTFETPSRRSVCRGHRHHRCRVGRDHGSTNYSDMWANAQEPGWGLNINQQADRSARHALHLRQVRRSRPGTRSRCSSTPSVPTASSPTAASCTRPPAPRSASPTIRRWSRYRQVGRLTIEFGDDAHALLTLHDRRRRRGQADHAPDVRATIRSLAPTSAPRRTSRSTARDAVAQRPRHHRHRPVHDHAGAGRARDQVPGLHDHQRRVHAAGPDRHVDAIYNCLGGVAGEIKFSALQSEKGGIVGTYTGQDKPARSAATSAATRAAQVAELVGRRAGPPQCGRSSRT